MDLILWRHAEAEPGEPDLGRRLTAKGIKQAERMATWLEGHLPDTCRILVSPADRAQQTALALKRKFRTVPEIAPGATVASVLAAAGWPDAREPVLIVGHQPTLGEVAAFLLSGTGRAVERAQGRGVVADQPRARQRLRGRAQSDDRSGFRLIAARRRHLRSEPSRKCSSPRSKLAYAIRKSATHGRGAFATRTIRKGAKIIEYRGKRSSYDEACEKPDSDPADPFHTLLFEVSDGSVIDAGMRGSAAKWINHSCAPNCEPIEHEICACSFTQSGRSTPGKSSPTTTVWCYHGRLSKRARNGMACRCGARSCRGTMLDLRRAKSAR